MVSDGRASLSRYVDCLARNGKAAVMMAHNVRIDYPAWGAVKVSDQSHRRQTRKRKNNKDDHLCSMAAYQTYILDDGWELTVEINQPDDNGDENIGEENKKKLTATDDKKMKTTERVIAK